MRLSVITGVALLAAAGTAQASIFTIADGNSSARVDTNSIGGTRPGMDQWNVDGVNHLFSQWFWYRADWMNREERINNLPELFAGTSNTNFDPADDVLTVIYGDNKLEIEVKFSIQGGTPGSRASDIGEQIRITNRMSQPMRLSFFQYSDFDLGADIQDDYVGIINPNVARQADFGSGLTLNETVVTPAASNWEVNTYANTINRLDDNNFDNLNGDAGPYNLRRDWTWAFQWNVEIAPGATFRIAKDKNIVPAPGALALIGLAGVFAGRRRR